MDRRERERRNYGDIDSTNRANDVSGPCQDEEALVENHLDRKKGTDRFVEVGFVIDTSDPQRVRRDGMGDGQTRKQENGEGEGAHTGAPVPDAKKDAGQSRNRLPPLKRPQP